ncbi:unnamed protein product [Vitrella brassicaformis CCMP3155]|uniref:Uncharacterized protein n=3 Tax=Vitrella brassicaformis TaxID=1169539 RepID=A0A0G4EXF6_VITBC|nr:unnamed protein product [Vitrella brassicaformis CCMP3155]|eukprot:CEM03259.1 unnamed protein product [Vitrella brassicaformis CCMP3155]
MIRSHPRLYTMNNSSSPTPELRADTDDAANGMSSSAAAPPPAPESGRSSQAERADDDDAAMSSFAVAPPPAPRAAADAVEESKQVPSVADEGPEASEQEGVWGEEQEAAGVGEAEETDAAGVGEAEAPVPALTPPEPNPKPRAIGSRKTKRTGGRAKGIGQGPAKRATRRSPSTAATVKSQAFRRERSSTTYTNRANAGSHRIGQTCRDEKQSRKQEGVDIRSCIGRQSRKRQNTEKPPPSKRPKLEHSATPATALLEEGDMAPSPRLDQQSAADADFGEDQRQPSCRVKFDLTQNRQTDFDKDLPVTTIQRPSSNGSRPNAASQATTTGNADVFRVHRTMTPLKSILKKSGGSGRSSQAERADNDDAANGMSSSAAAPPPAPESGRSSQAERADDDDAAMSSLAVAPPPAPRAAADAVEESKQVPSVADEGPEASEQEGVWGEEQEAAGVGEAEETDAAGVGEAEAPVPALTPPEPNPKPRAIGSRKTKRTGGRAKGIGQGPAKRATRRSPSTAATVEPIGRPQRRRTAQKAINRGLFIQTPTTGWSTGALTCEKGEKDMYHWMRRGSVLKGAYRKAFFPTYDGSFWLFFMLICDMFVLQS